MTRAARLADVLSLRLSPGAIRRAVVAGTLWGGGLTVALVALRAWQCGLICVDDVAYTAILSVTGGILTLGPLAAFSAQSATHAAAQSPNA
ncbi:MAG TPA: hypothetical protein VHA77_12930 [Xanthobacteraceae bacterium]|nr:hypothetical protein [Xanthobacteraceae bacterium]